MLLGLLGCTQTVKNNPVFKPTVEGAKPGTLYISEDYTKVWPQPAGEVGSPGHDLCWHLDNEHSQLKAAREMVMKRMKSEGIKPVRIMILDTGYDENYETLRADRPKEGRIHLNTRLARNFVKGENPGSAVESSSGDHSGTFGHGTGTINILAGPKVRVMKETSAGYRQVHDDYLGAIPMAEIIPVRISKSVFLTKYAPMNILFNTSHQNVITEALHYAADDLGDEAPDVISMSMGSHPSDRLGKAVQHAYDSGIAMAFAAGNHLTTPVTPFNTPRQVVYPAGYPWAICVSGATHEDRTYGYTKGLFNNLSNLRDRDLYMRGNFGPYFHNKPSFENNVLSAYTPNIPWSEHSGGTEPKNPGEAFRDKLSLQGGGTSSATPQVAAALALWLQYYRPELEEMKLWHKPKAVEMAYQALFQSAKKAGKEQGRKQEPDYGETPYTTAYLGWGILQAKDAIVKFPPKSFLKDNAKMLRTPLAIEKSDRISDRLFRLQWWVTSWWRMPPLRAFPK